MIEIKGKYNVAKCFADFVDDGAVEQITAVCDQQAFADSKIRIMPDVHAGKGCTIGTTMTITDKIVPAMVGVDIGCGMYTVSLGKVDIDLQKFDEVVHKIPCGREVWDCIKYDFNLLELQCYVALKDRVRLAKSLGTLGGGNHFIEIDVDDEGNKYLVVHSGSRNLGTQVAEFYQQVAVELNLGKKEYLQDRQDMIQIFKRNGQQQQIQSTLKNMDKKFAKRELTMPRELCYLYGIEMDDYIHDVDVCQQFAQKNREKIAEYILKKAKLTAKESFHTIHNYVDVKNMILRKGSVSAQKGEKILIPINMRDGALICTGKGNQDWNFSAPHGAGRLMSRSKARDVLDMEEYKKQMAGIYTTCVVKGTLDESPMAYKNMDDIVKNIQPTADILCRIKPIYNFKATE